MNKKVSIIERGKNKIRENIDIVKKRNKLNNKVYIVRTKNKIKKKVCHRNS